MLTQFSVALIGASNRRGRCHRKWIAEDCAGRAPSMAYQALALAMPAASASFPLKVGDAITGPRFLWKQRICCGPFEPRVGWNV